MKNYTSSVPVEVTVMRIEKILAKNYATQVAKEYKNGEIYALTFSVQNPATMKESRIRLPVEKKGIIAALGAQYKRKISSATKARIEAQANRTAWKLWQDWLEVQMSLIEMEQAEFVQIFLPYFWDGRRTLYDRVKEGGFKMLGTGGEEVKP
ncbi:MAG: hypothetical protein IMZ46_02370 [Acidobacteria bacterium]|nr:hypothetical protein [Acidobacteriota bacterium]